MSIKRSLEDLKKQMKDSELEAYKILDDMPSIVKTMGGYWIDEAKKRLEAENKKVKEKVKLLEEALEFNN